MALNPIACEHCRSKKCKCDRKLPHCSQCQTLSLSCRYAEGGKRGIPAAYINSLEDRLTETEAALYSALRTIDSMNSNGAVGQLLVDVTGPLVRERSKVEKQDEWKRLPLRSGAQLQIWFEDKAQSDHQVQQHCNMHTSLNGCPQRTRTEELVSDGAAEAVNASTEPSSIDHAPTSRTPTNIHISTQSQQSTQWRNYF